MGAVSFIFNLSPKSLTLNLQDSIFLKNSNFKSSIGKSKVFLESFLTRVKNISSDAAGKVENLFKSNDSGKEEDYELQLGLALSASLQDTETSANSAKSDD